MKKGVVAVIIIIVLLAIPTTLAITSGELFPEEIPPYKIGVVTEFESANDPYVIQFLSGVSSVRQSKDVYLRIISDGGDAQNVIDELCRVNECNMIITTGNNIISAMKEAALRHPDVQFVTIDGGLTEEELPENMADIQFKSEESSYIAGYIAGKMTQTNVIGFIGGTDTPPIDRFYYGFKAGIDTAAREAKKEIRVVRETLGTYNDMELGYDAGVKMYTEDNCDIIFAAAGTSGIGAIAAATLLEKYVIGVDMDQNYLSPKYVIFSVIKDLPYVSSDVMLAYADGRNYGGQIISKGCTDSSVDVVGFISVVPKSAGDYVKSLKEMIAAGEITVPYNKETYEAFA
ncbi:MAG: BMP family ABC transporter substrate-binding protein [Methanocorpusculum sp.]|nr:BMP family ABC transporter substrate-binding protein [Methanocorpusculum sp.]